MWPEIHLLDATLPGLADNLALDEALLLEAEERDGPAVLRIWELDRFAVVLGASGRMAEDVRVEACRADGVAIARRSSGGGTVVIGPGALNFAVVLPVAAATELLAVDTAQLFVLGRTADAIRRLGPPVEVLGSGDLTIGLRKFSGSAQRRLRRNLLIHASILYDFPLERIERYTGLPSRKPAYRGDRPHSDFVTNLPMTRTALVEAIRSAWLPAGHPARPVAIPAGRVRELSGAKFGDLRWIERL